MLKIRDLTGGEGADVVFELVGTQATMPHAVNALRRSGRLVFIGYSADSLVVSPLQTGFFPSPRVGNAEGASGGNA